MQIIGSTSKTTILCVATLIARRSAHPIRHMRIRGGPSAAFLVRLTSKEGSGPDRSMADFFWCLRAAQRGWSIEETADKLLEVSARAQDRARFNDEGYALITAQNAAAAVERNPLKMGRG
jgi:hypothetical protein